MDIWERPRQTMIAWDSLMEKVDQAEQSFGKGEYGQARKMSWAAAHEALQGYREVRASQGDLKKDEASGNRLADLAAQVELPMEVFAVCERLGQEDPNGPSKLLPTRPEGELAEERIHQSRSLIRFLRWAVEEPPESLKP